VKAFVVVPIGNIDPDASPAVCVTTGFELPCTEITHIPFPTRNSAQHIRIDAAGIKYPLPPPPPLQFPLPAPPYHPPPPPYPSQPQPEGAPPYPKPPAQAGLLNETQVPFAPAADCPPPSPPGFEANQDRDNHFRQ